MNKKIIIALLTLMCIFTFAIQQNTYALYIEDGGEWDNGLKWKLFNAVLNDYNENFSYFKVTKPGTIVGKNEIQGDIVHYVWSYPIDDSDNNGLILQTLLYVSEEPSDDDVAYFYNIDQNEFIMGQCLLPESVSVGKYYELWSYGDSYPKGTNPIVEGDYTYVDCASQDDAYKKKDDLVNNGNPPDNGQTGGQLTDKGYEFDKVKYDLPIPKGVTVSHKDATFEQNTYMDDTTTGDYFINWAIDEDLAKKSYINDLMLKADIKCFGKTRFSIVNDWKDWETDYFPLMETPAINQRYKFNQTDDSIQSYYHDFEKKSQDWNISIGPVFGTDTSNQNFRLKNPNVLLTYHYTDEKNGVEHYSKKSVLVVVHDDSYQTYEVDTETDIIDSDYGNKELNSDEVIKDENLIDDNYIEEITTDTSSSSFIGKVKNFMNEIGNVPRYFARIFSFLPDWSLEFIAFGFTIIVAVGVLKAIF